MKNKRTIKTILTLALALILTAAAPAVAYATDISVAANSTSVKAGDTVTVTITVSAKNISVAGGVFTYDPSLLTYVSGSGGASDGYINMVSAQKGGSSSLSAVIKFKASGEGEAVIDVSIDSVLDYSGSKLESAQAGVSITVKSSGTVQEPEPGETAAPDFSVTGIPAQNVAGTDAQMYIWRSLNTLTLPSGFVDHQVSYSGEYVGGAAIPDSEDLILLYLSEKAGENPGYYIYGEEKNTLIPYLTVLSVSASYTLLWPDESITVPEGFENTVFDWKGKTVPAWIMAGLNGYVLIYARNPSGEKGLFLYNTEDESVQRYSALAQTESEPTMQPSAQPSPITTKQPADTQSDASMDENLILLYAALAGCALFAAAAAIFAALYFSKRRSAKSQKAAETDPDEPEAEVSDKSASKRNPRRKSTRVRNNYAFHSDKDTPSDKNIDA